MFHLFHLGPLPLGRRRQWLVGAIDESGGFAPPVLHKDLGRAVKLMAERFGEEDIALEPALAAFAPALRVAVAPLPEYLDDAPAVLAFSTVNVHEELPRGTAIRTFLEACRAYGAVAPWERYRADQAFRMTILAGRRETTREALVLGAQGEPCGLALYDRPGDALRALRALRAGETRAAEKLDAITLAFSSEPAWALHAVRSAFSLPELPFVFRTRRGHVGPTRAVELGALTAALEVVTSVCADETARGRPAEAVLCIDGDEFRARAFPPGDSLPDQDVPGLPPRTPAGSRLLH